MKIADLRTLAEWHQRQALIAERDAAHWEKQIIVHGRHLEATAAAVRERAQWHSSTATYLGDIADALLQLLTAIKP